MNTFNTIEEYDHIYHDKIFTKYSQEKDLYARYISSFNESYDIGIAAENSFYNNCLNEIRHFMQNTWTHQPVILFDIDDTIASKSIKDQNIDYIRPCFFLLINQLQKEFPQLLFGILSQRREWPPVAIRNLFNEKYIICSHGFPIDHVADAQYAFTDGSERPIYVEKINAYLDLCSQNPNWVFFLIDDILSIDKKTSSNPLVAQGKWYGVTKKEKFTPEYQLIGISSNFDLHL
jgi:hypothetical protein